MAAPIDLHEVMEREREERFRTRWRVKACASTACLSAGAGATIKAMEDLVERDDMALEVQVIPTGCMGLCSAGPLMRMMRRGGDETDYQKVKPMAPEYTPMPYFSSGDGEDDRDIADWLATQAGVAEGAEVVDLPNLQ